jgi:ABC-type branched-subunit amino acid transport system permease subunit
VRARWPALAGVALALPWLLPSSYALHIAVMAALYVTLATSLNLVMGLGGLLSLAHPAFFGVGAYAAALVALGGGSFLGGLAAAVLLAALAGLVVGIPALRLTRHAFVMVTLSFTLLTQLLALNWTGLTRGPMGLPGVPLPRVGGLTVRSKSDFYYLALLVAALCVAGITLFARAPAGRALVAVRESEALAAALGIHPLRYRLHAFVVAAAWAGAAGAVYAHYVSVVDPSVFDFYWMESLLVMVTLGGPGSVGGVVAAAIAFTALPEWLRISQDLRMVAYGAILLLAIVFLPEGLGGWLRARRARRALAAEAAGA